MMMRRAGQSRSPGKDMTMYEFAKECIIYTGFGMVLALDAFGIGYWIYTLAKWLKKVRRRDRSEKKQ